MSDELNEMIEAKAVLEEGLTVVDEEERAVLQIALLATVYFEAPYKREVREAIVACFEDYFQRCGQELRWVLSSIKRRFEPYGAGKGSRPRDWILDLGENESFSLVCHGAKHDRGASMFQVEALGIQRRPYDVLGYLQVAFPLPWFSDHPGSLPEVMLEICRKLKPVSGYGGIGVIESPDIVVRQRQVHIIYALAHRFPGIEIDDPGSHSIWLPTGREDRTAGIKSVNWLTVLSDRYLAELGGADAVQAKLGMLDRRFVVRRFDGGVMIQAGDHPELGDAQRDLWPELYVKLAKYLRPIRVVRYGTGPRSDIEPVFDSEAWLRRFDAR